jgi:hypothetical protein
VDAYCERAAPDFWAEPLNAASNLAFLIAAALLWRSFAAAREANAGIADEVRALPWLLALVGVCSFLFHTLATVWAGLADQLAILLFGCAFLYAFLRRAAGAAGWLSLSAAVAFSVISYLAPRALPPGFLNGSASYFPYLAGQVAMTAFLLVRGVSAGRGFAVGTGLFCVSLTVRTIDEPLCRLFPLGTHFVWHLLNAVLLFVLTRSLASASTAHAASQQLTPPARSG